jgi:transcriptional regulator of arginine metabolism
LHNFAKFLNKYAFVMKGKLERQRVIREIIKDSKVSNQEELSALLDQRGMSVAQATLSRDIRELRITKIHDGNGYRYSLPQPGMLRAVFHESSLSSDSIDSLEFSGSMTVIKTRPGHAGMIASIIDEAHLPEVMGTLAGDDTILLVIRESFSHDDVAESLAGLFKGIGDKRVN